MTAIILPYRTTLLACSTLLALVTLVIKTIAEHRNEQALKAAAELPPERPSQGTTP